MTPTAATCRGNLPRSPLSSGPRFEPSPRRVVHIDRGCGRTTTYRRGQSSFVPPVDAQAAQFALERPTINVEQLSHSGDVLVFSQQPFDVLDF